MHCGYRSHAYLAPRTTVPAETNEASANSAVAIHPLSSPLNLFDPFNLFNPKSDASKAVARTHGSSEPLNATDVHETSGSTPPRLPRAPVSARGERRPRRRRRASVLFPKCSKALQTPQMFGPSRAHAIPASLAVASRRTESPFKSEAPPFKTPSIAPTAGGSNRGGGGGSSANSNRASPQHLAVPVRLHPAVPAHTSDASGEWRRASTETSPVSTLYQRRSRRHPLTTPAPRG